MKKKFSSTWVCLTAIVFVLISIMPMSVQAAEKVDYSVVFDADYYYNAYGDLRTAIGYDSEALMKHFVTYGMQEGRRGNAEFDVRAYMENNPDLIQAFGGSDYTSYYLHYITYGKRKGASQYPIIQK